jgi:hypothetical protein
MYLLRNLICFFGGIVSDYNTIDFMFEFCGFGLLDNQILPLGMGTNWTISKHTWTDIGYEDDEEDVVHTYYNFVLFDYNDKGFRFTINEKDLKSFGEYLLGCCEYMLAHGNPI